LIDEKTFNRMHEVISHILNKNPATPLPQAFYEYCRPLADRKSLATYVRHKLDTIHLTGRGIRGSVILDAGCGFGITCLLFSLMGAKESHGVDIMESRLSAFEAFLERLNLRLPIYPKLQSVSALDYSADLFDIVFSNEAISHYRDLPRFFKEMHRVLKKGGVLVISDANNGANPSLVRESRRIWDRFEQGPVGSVGRHKIEKPYAAMRQEIIQKAFPQLSMGELADLRKGSFGMDQKEILQASQEYMRSGKLPQSFYTGRECPLNPVTGAVIERFFHPLRLAREMSSYGLRAKAYAYFGGARGNPFIRITSRLLASFSRLTIHFAPGFKIVAVKDE
jgi:ubiquinone/menaquinone biosynthesis C-methylase UbiE